MDDMAHVHHVDFLQTEIAKAGVMVCFAFQAHKPYCIPLNATTVFFLN